jgi:hypothetical protein
MVEKWPSVTSTVDGGETLKATYVTDGSLRYSLTATVYYTLTAKYCKYLVRIVTDLNNVGQSFPATEISYFWRPYLSTTRFYLTSDDGNIFSYRNVVHTR